MAANKSNFGLNGQTVAFVFGACMVSSVGGQNYGGNCEKNFDNCTGQAFCGAPGNCDSSSCQYKCYPCTCTNRTQCYFTTGTHVGCNCTGFGTIGINCEINIDECSPNPCRHGNCTDGINSYTCSCDAGYEGTNCETNINECASYPCQHGNCIDGINSYTCSCDAGYEGTHCEINIDDCILRPCHNCGSCVDGVNSYTCVCTPGFFGTNCENDFNECSPTNPCNEGFMCSNTPGGFCCS